MHVQTAYLRQGSKAEMIPSPHFWGDRRPRAGGSTGHCEDRPGT